MSPRVWRVCHRGGLLAIGIACVTATPLVTGGQDTHTHQLATPQCALPAVQMRPCVLFEVPSRLPSVPCHYGRRLEC
jgi:hypothetical protein